VTLDQYYMLAQIIASLAVVGSLLFLGFETRSNAKQTRLANWEVVVDRFNAMWRRTADLAFADVVARGRQDYAGLSDAEKIAFGDYYRELTITFETMALSGAHATVSRQEWLEVTKKDLRYWFGFPGAQAWWREWNESVGMPPQITRLINEAISEGPP
jgi:hypothetical protein